jgi:hypothetical protein
MGAFRRLLVIVWLPVALSAPADGLCERDDRVIVEFQ